MNSFSFNNRRDSGFTLIELIVVISIIGMLMVFTVPAITGAMKSGKIGQTAELLRSQLAFAQGAAMRENAPIQVRFFLYDDPDSPGTDERFQAFQFYRRKAFDRSDISAGSTANSVELMEPIGPLKKLGAPVVFAASERLSSICGLQKTQGKIPWKRGDEKQAQFVAFDFKADGSTNLPGRERWFITLVEESDDRAGKIPNNFATVQVDPFTGQLRLFRP